MTATQRGGGLLIGSREEIIRGDLGIEKRLNSPRVNGKIPDYVFLSKKDAKEEQK